MWQRMGKSSPGSDGLPYQDWGVREAGKGATLAEGGAAPPSLTASHTVYMPRGEYHANATRPARRSKQLRPVKLMQSSAKLLAGATSHALLVFPPFFSEAGRKMGEDPDAMVLALRRIVFCPMVAELLATLWRAVLCGWCTTARFTQAVEQRQFCRELFELQGLADVVREDGLCGPGS